MSDRKESILASADIAAAAFHKEWDELSCPICMDHPHNTVLLICSSHDKGCRTYICDTSYRHSNCLDRFRKLKMNDTDNASENTPSHIGYSGHNSSVISEPSALAGNNLLQTFEAVDLDQDVNNISSSTIPPDVLHSNRQGPGIQIEEITVPAESNCLRCPLCRGTIMGWTIIKEARQYLDEKPRTCSRESCSFSGNYRELRRHARRMHPATRPADVDPSRQRAWRRLEHQREYGDVLSAVRTAMPGAIVLGDYVIENGDGLLRDRNRENNRLGEAGGSWWTTVFLLHMINNPDRSEDEPRGLSRAGQVRRRSGHQNLWRERLLRGRHDDAEDVDDDISIPRRRRRIQRSRSEDEE